MHHSPLLRSDSVSTSGVLFVGLLTGELLAYAIDHSRLLRGLDDPADQDDEYTIQSEELASQGGGAVLP